jgi:hypothetical protein
MKHIAYYCLAAASMLAGSASAQVRPGPASAPAASSAAVSAAAPISKDAVLDRLFGGQPRPYAKFGQQYALATSAAPQLKAGPGLLGTSRGDAAGATLSQIYNGKFNFVVWNDQFYDAPRIAGCVKSCSGPWGRSKGVLAWNDPGEGVIMQGSLSGPRRQSSQNGRGGLFFAVQDPALHTSVRALLTGASAAAAP